MSKFSSFIELLVKQTCRRASHEFEMGSKHSSAPLPIISEHDATGIYSLHFLKSLHDKPKDNIYKLLKSPDDLNGAQSPNGLNWLNSSEFSDTERKTLLEFLIKVKNMSPSKAQNWIDLHHYMHYAYRNFVNPNPDPSAEKLSPFFNAEMTELVQSLLEEDESQLYLRILALLREYCIFAQWNYSKCDKDHAITRLFYYYEAMLSAAKNLSSVFSELEVIIYKTYSVCWIDFNTCVFIRYFFETDYVQKKINQCLETKTSPGDTSPMFSLLEDLKDLWIKEQKRIKKINEDHSLVEGTVPYYIEEAMIGNHKKVLTSNFWMERTQKEVPKKFEQENGRVDKENEVAAGKTRLSSLLNFDDENEVDEATNVCQSRVGTCDHHKDSQNCDCTYCEVFGINTTTRTMQNNELRDRLRIRLHQRRDKRTKETFKGTPINVNGNLAGTTQVRIKTVINKVEERVPLPSSPTNIPPAPSVKSSDSSLATTSGQDDIHGLVNYIEGNIGLNKMEMAQKKAAKKERQRMKKEEDRMKAEEEQKKLAEEQRMKETEKKKEQARKLAEIEKSKAAAEAAAAKALKEMKKKSKKERQAEKRKMAQQQRNPSTKTIESNIFEETIPAMVTIKRIAENGNGTPTVTITLKGSTPDQDKLLYTLVNGSDDVDNGETIERNLVQNSKKKKKRKQQEPGNTPKTSSIIKKEMRVTVEVHSNRVYQGSKLTVNQPATTKTVVESKRAASKKNTGGPSELSIPMLRLPPGITITKVEGPLPNRNYHVGNVDEQKGSTINVEKSGVIVVDTEKLIQDSQSETNPSTSGKSKKNKKKKKKKSATVATVEAAQTDKKIITLKNPIFQSMPLRSSVTAADRGVDLSAPAAIFTNENGMVTIRSSRLQQSLSDAGNYMPVATLLPPTNQNLPPARESPKVVSPFNAQEILSGLPGIEITKVDKKVVKTDSEANKASQTAQVSIIPTSNGEEKNEFEKDDWLYDNVFTPRDTLEDMDPEELELEAFKRFCQQSVPPKRKKKLPI